MIYCTRYIDSVSRPVSCSHAARSAPKSPRARGGVRLAAAFIRRRVHRYHLVKNFFELFLRQGIQCLVYIDGVVEKVRAARAASSRRATQLRVREGWLYYAVRSS